MILSSFYGHLQVVELLLSRGANPNELNKFGYSAVMWAATNGYMEIAKLLIDNGADVNIISQFGDTALLFASYRGKTEMVKLLIDSGGMKSLTHVDLKGNTAQSLAMEMKHIDTLAIIEEALKLMPMQSQEDLLRQNQQMIEKKKRE